MPDSPQKSTPLNAEQASIFEERIRRAAAGLPYPRTPPLAARERQRLAAPRRKPGGLAVGMALLVVLLLAAWLATPAAARVLDWIRLGAVRIFLTQPTPTPTPPPGTALPAGAPALPGTATITPTFLQSALDLAGETSLAQARQEAGFTIHLPGEPPDLGDPDYVFLQTLRTPVVVMVWMTTDPPGQVRLVLSQTAADRVIFEKYSPGSVQDVQVNGRPGLWLDGQYLLVTREGEFTMTRLLDQGHTLIWTSGDITFRLETAQDLDSAIRTAESMEALK